MKTCNKCMKSKPFDDFHNHAKSKDGKSGRCKTCSAEYNKEWQLKNPAKARASWRKAEAKSRDNFRNRATRHGLTRDELDALYKASNGLCDICGREPARWLNVDHDHETGKVRGLLCLACNTGLGNFQDSVEWLQKAIEYLTK
jgi:hypothetical protein